MCANSTLVPRFAQRSGYSQASASAMLAGFGAAYYQPAAEEFLIVQFFHGALRFLDGLHLYECETF